MALASAAVLLSRKGNRVAALDWDLENPSLHRFFGLTEATKPGLMDLCWEGLREFRDLDTKEELPNSTNIAPDLRGYITSLGSVRELGKLDFMSAGVQDRRFNVRVRYFSWSEFYDRFDGAAFINSVFDWLVAEYDFVLIDCWSSKFALPFPLSRSDKLLVCFTFDVDSIRMAADLVDSLRLKMNPGLEIYPVPMRVDNSERDRLQDLQSLARHEFRPYLEALDDKYWNTVEVPEIPLYKYTRVLPVLREAYEDPKSITAAYLRLLEYVTNANVSSTRLQPRMSSEQQTPKAPAGRSKFAIEVTPYQGKGKYGFVSYARADLDLVIPIIQDINYLDYRLWWDEAIPGGAEWDAYLREKIANSKFLLLFLSKRAAASKHIHDEIESARQNQKPIVALRLDNAELPLSIQNQIGRYQMLDVSAVSFDENLERTLHLLYAL
jgi:cellulose biosynthesis protein BcsQ